MVPTRRMSDDRGFGAAPFSPSRFRRDAFPMSRFPRDAISMSRFRVAFLMSRQDLSQAPNGKRPQKEHRGRIPLVGVSARLLASARILAGAGTVALRCMIGIGTSCTHAAAEPPATRRQLMRRPTDHVTINCHKTSPISRRSCGPSSTIQPKCYAPKPFSSPAYDVRKWSISCPKTICIMTKMVLIYW